MSNVMYIYKNPDGQDDLVRHQVGGGVVRAVNWVMGHPVTLDRVGVFLMNGNVAPFPFTG